MTLELQQRETLYELVDALCDDQLDDAGHQQLAALLADDDALGLYVAQMNMHAGLAWDFDLGPATEAHHEHARTADGTVKDNRQSPPALVDLPSSSPLLPAPSFLSSAFHGGVAYCSSGWPMAYLTSAVVCAIGILILASIPVHHHVQLARQSNQRHSAPASRPSPLASSSSEFPPLIGQITGMVDCKWSDPQTEAFDRAYVPLGRKYAISSGMMEITYDTGARVILQGPCTYEVESKTGGYLSLGKLTARVEKGPRSKAQGPGTAAVVQGAVVSKSEIQNQKSEISNPQSLIPNPSLSTLHSPLFTIKTPAAIVTDLGTEFGVEVGQSGETTSYVFCGAVSVQVAGDDKETKVAPLVLREDQSARVQQSGDKCVIVPGISVKPAAFVRELAKPTIKTFDLVDVVAGGDGFSGRRNAGIDPTTGRVTDIPPPPAGFEFTGNDQYLRVDGMPFIDGLFVPNGGTGGVQVDSAGHVFAGFPDTAYQSSSYLWAGGAIPVPPSLASIATELNGIDYASSGHGLLFLHANKGVTFDLNAIRKANAGFTLQRFRAVAGNVNSESVFDLWVLVDGQPHFRRRQTNGTYGAFSIAFSINHHERFLTLAATDGGDGIGGDWVIFGDPRLELVPTETSPKEAATR